MKKRTIIWEPDSLIDYYQVARGLELNYIIYVIDALENLIAYGQQEGI